MAGKHRAKRGASGAEAVTVRMPGALKAHLSDAALAHGRSLSEEVVMRLMPTGERRREMRRELMGLQPMPGDTRSDAEIVVEMDKVYERWDVPAVNDGPMPVVEIGEPELTDAQVDETLGGVSWLNPGGWPRQGK